MVNVKGCDLRVLWSLLQYLASPAFEHKYVSLISIKGKQPLVCCTLASGPHPQDLLVLRGFLAAPQAGEGLVEPSLRPASYSLYSLHLASVSTAPAGVPAAWAGVATGGEQSPSLISFPRGEAQKPDGGEGAGEGISRVYGS